MKNIVLFFAALFLCFSSFAQKSAPGCYCPTKGLKGMPSPYKPNTKATRIFDLGNARSIALCGYEEKKLIKGKILYSGFVLSVCGSDRPIDFWGETKYCDIKQNKDTLYVETLTELPATPTGKETLTAWTIERFYFAGDKLKRTLTVDPKLPKYSAAQIATVFKLYATTADDNSDKVAELADKLFICAISGSKQAGKYLETFKTKFTRLDGATAESYDYTFGMFKLWQKQGYKTVDIK